MKRIALQFALIALIAVPLFARSNDLVLPVLGHLAVNGVLYTSEIVVTNHRDAEQHIRVDWLGREGVGSRVNATHRLLTRRVATFDRGGMVYDILGINNYGMGAVRLVAVDEAGNVDPNGDIDATAYIVAYRPGGSSSRQEIEAVPSSDYHAERVTLFALGTKEFARTNIGLVNLEATPRRFRVEIWGGESEPMEIEVPGMAMRQVPLQVSEDQIGPSFLSVTPIESTGGWAAYASSVDSTTGDAWTARRVPLGHRFNP